MTLTFPFRFRALYKQRPMFQTLRGLRQGLCESCVRTEPGPPAGLTAAVGTGCPLFSGRSAGPGGGPDTDTLLSRHVPPWGSACGQL